MPVLTPAELWETTGRIAIPEIFRVKDRTGRDFILPLTHEETVTFHAREIQSYRELPQLWYHFQTKDRDEPRPRGGLLRVREFIMKDAYSFDRDEDGVRASFEANRLAYKKIFVRCGVETYDVQAESGIMERFDRGLPSGDENSQERHSSLRRFGFDAFCLPRVAAGETAGMFASPVAGNATRERGERSSRREREIGVISQGASTAPRFVWL